MSAENIIGQEVREPVLSPVDRVSGRLLGSWGQTTFTRHPECRGQTTFTCSVPVTG